MRTAGATIQHVPLRQPPDEMDNYAHCEAGTTGIDVGKLKHRMAVIPRFR